MNLQGKSLPSRSQKPTATKEEIKVPETAQKTLKLTPASNIKTDSTKSSASSKAVIVNKMRNLSVEDTPSSFTGLITPERMDKTPNTSSKKIARDRILDSSNQTQTKRKTKAKKF